MNFVQCDLSLYGQIGTHVTSTSLSMDIPYNFVQAEVTTRLTLASGRPAKCRIIPVSSEVFVFFYRCRSVQYGELFTLKSDVGHFEEE